MATKSSIQNSQDAWPPRRNDETLHNSQLSNIDKSKDETSLMPQIQAENNRDEIAILETDRDSKIIHTQINSPAM